MISTLPIEILLKILGHIGSDPVVEDRLIKTCRMLKNAILLYNRSRCNVYSPAIVYKSSYLFDLQYHPLPWMLSGKDIIHRLFILGGSLLETIASVENVVLAGGSVALALDSRVSIEDLEKSKTDLDFFLYGIRQQQTVALSSILQVLAANKPFYQKRNNVVDVFIPGFPRMIQLVLASECHPYDIVSAFDFGYLQTYYDGTSVYASNLAIVALRERSTILNLGTVAKMPS